MLKITILCAEDALLQQCGEQLGRCSGIKIVGRTNSLQDAGRHLTFGRSDIVIMDDALLRLEGAEAIRGLHRGYPLTKSLLLLTKYNKNSILLAISLGIQAVIQRDRMDEELFGGLAALLTGEVWVLHIPSAPPGSGQSGGSGYTPGRNALGRGQGPLLVPKYDGQPYDHVRV